MTGPVVKIHIQNGKWFGLGLEYSICNDDTKNTIFRCGGLWDMLPGRYAALAQAKATRLSESRFPAGAL